MYPNDDSLDGLNAVRYRYDTLGLSTNGLDNAIKYIDSSDISCLHTIMSDSLFASHTVRVVGTPVEDESRCQAPLKNIYAFLLFLES